MHKKREELGISLPFVYLKVDSLFMAGPTTWFYHNYNTKDSIEITNQFSEIQVFIGQYEITNRQYNFFLESLNKDSLFELYEICKVDNKSWLRKDSLNPYYISMAESYHTSEIYLDYPVVNINFTAVKEYINWLNRKEPSKNIIYKLPDQDEWTFGFNSLPANDSTYAWGTDSYCAYDNSLLGNFAILNAEQLRYNQVTDDMWFHNYDKEGYMSNINGPLKVYSYNPNNWGAYNMSGNVAEIVDIKPVVDGDSTIYWTKGGSWFSPPYYCRKNAWEKYKLPNPAVGFRVMKYELIRKN